MRKKILDYAELKEAYEKLLKETSILQAVSGYNENKQLKEDIQKLKRIIVKQKRQIQDLSILLDAKIRGENKWLSLY